MERGAVLLLLLLRGCCVNVRRTSVNVELLRAMNACTLYAAVMMLFKVR